MAENRQERNALLVGATGLIGGLLLERLLMSSRYKSVITLTRRPLSVTHSKLKNLVVDFDHLKENTPEFTCDDVFLCLGTTLKKAGSKAAFRHVDYELTLACAKLALDRGCSRAFLISSVGADPKNRSFYLKVKGEIEAELSKLPFQALHIFRPSFLIGKRTENRPLERIFHPLMQSISPLMKAGLEKFRPIEAETVTHAILKATESESIRTRIYSFKDMKPR